MCTICVTNDEGSRRLSTLTKEKRPISIVTTVNALKTEMFITLLLQSRFI